LNVQLACCDEKVTGCSNGFLTAASLKMMLIVLNAALALTTSVFFFSSSSSSALSSVLLACGGNLHSSVLKKERNTNYLGFTLTWEGKTESTGSPYPERD
jgi:hypothetical protein